MTRSQKVAKAQKLREQGLKLREIAEQMGAAVTTVSAWLCDPDGSKLRARKDSYRGECERCGAPTNGNNGKAAAPRRCIDCLFEDNRKTERNERLVEMWEAGEPTWYIAEKLGMAERTVLAWINTARRRQGRPISLRRLSARGTDERYQLIAELIRAGYSNAEIAQEVGASQESVNTMMTRARRLGYDMPYRSEVAS